MVYCRRGCVRSGVGPAGGVRDDPSRAFAGEGGADGAADDAEQQLRHFTQSIWSEAKGGAIIFMLFCISPFPFCTILQIDELHARVADLELEAKTVTAEREHLKKEVDTLHVYRLVHFWQYANHFRAWFIRVCREVLHDYPRSICISQSVLRYLYPFLWHIQT